jgi:hypothetical protein
VSGKVTGVSDWVGDDVMESIVQETFGLYQVEMCKLQRANRILGAQLRRATADNREMKSKLEQLSEEENDANGNDRTSISESS